MLASVIEVQTISSQNILNPNASLTMQLSHSDSDHGNGNVLHSSFQKQFGGEFKTLASKQNDETEFDFPDRTDERNELETKRPNGIDIWESESEITIETYPPDHSPNPQNNSGCTLGLVGPWVGG